MRLVTKIRLLGCDNSAMITTYRNDKLIVLRQRPFEGHDMIYTTS
mgnify:CR=1 FL=1